MFESHVTKYLFPNYYPPNTVVIEMQSVEFLEIPCNYHMQ